MRLPFIAAKDGTPLFYKDWGAGQPVVFISSWGMNSDMWQYQMTPMVDERLRCVAYDRRGHGRSGQPSHGYDYDTLADDLAAVIEQIDLRDAILVGHSMAGGEIVRYLSRHGAKRVSRIVLVAPTTPLHYEDRGQSGRSPSRGLRSRASGVARRLSGMAGSECASVRVARNVASADRLGPGSDDANLAKGDPRL
jgi:pimeloyl-ACP methyl ester carboxylesterase